MSLYRQPGARARRVAVAAGVAGLLAGFAAGLLVAGAGSDQPPTVRAALDALQDRLRPASSGLDLVAIEYRQAVRAGRVVAPTEYAAARAAVARARQAVTAARPDLAALDPNRTRELTGQLDRLAGLIAGRASPARVDALAVEAQHSLRSLLR